MTLKERVGQIVKANSVRKHTLLVGYALALVTATFVLQVVELFR